MTINIRDAVITISGARGTGKSTLAATYLPPSEVHKVFYIDGENSANSIRAEMQKKGLDFGHYIDLERRFPNIKSDDLLSQIATGKLPWVDSAGQNALINLYKYVLHELDEHLISGKYRVVVIDPLEKFEAGMAAYTEANKKATGWTTSAHGRMWTEAYYPLYQSVIAAIHARGVEVIILNSHLRTPWENNRPVVGKVEPGGKPLLYKLSSLMLWIVNNRDNADGAPAALVLKERLGQIDIVGDEWAITRRLPERIPHATWSDIRRYLKVGVDLSKPSQGETMSEAEREMISELLSDAQMRLMILQAESEARESSIVQPASGAFSLPTGAVVASTDNGHADTESQARARVLLSEGKSKRQAADELGMTLPELIRLTK